MSIKKKIIGIGGWLYYLGIKILSIPEKDFWKMTPRKLCILAELHYKYSQLNGKGVEDEEDSLGYIDEIFN